ncbi:MAG: adenylate kinase [Clostridia bacterium]|nr:adenylate kinase [Clostridia bacterium]
MKIVFLGPPGAGKGTQAVRVCTHMGVPQISTGVILRRAMQEGTETGAKAKAFVDAGQLVPDELVIAIVAERLQESDCANGCILDGFPRTVAQAEALEKFASLDAVVNIAVADEELVARLSGRRVCPSCGGTYHIALDDTADCKACGTALVQRDDDKPETVLNRLSVYHGQTKPLIDFYGARGLLKTIDGSQTPDACFADIIRALEADG